MGASRWFDSFRKLLGRSASSAPRPGAAASPTNGGPLPTSGRTMEMGLEVLARRHRISTVIDVGASNGMWTQLARRFFPDSAYLLIEAQGVHHEDALRRLRGEHPSIEYVIAAAGNREGTIHFDANDPFGGAASEAFTGRNDLVVPMTTIDAEVGRRGLRPPFLVKLDTHGFEVPILEGARETLASSGALVIEAYGFELRPGCLRFHELCAYLEERGFRCIDIVDTMYRPFDDALWQMDLLFVPTSAPHLSHNSFE